MARNKKVNEYAKIYREAAEIIANGKELACCPAINASKTWMFGTLKLPTPVIAFADLFRPGSKSFGRYWWVEPNPYRKMETEQIEAHEARIFALLLAAEIAQEENWTCYKP